MTLRSNAGNLSELAANGTLASELSVVAHRESVGLVPDTLQQMQRAVSPVQQDGLTTPWHEDLLLPLRERDDRHIFDLERSQRARRGTKLSLPAIDDREIGRRK